MAMTVAGWQCSAQEKERGRERERERERKIRERDGLKKRNDPVWQ
jgi:hypothetical protein